MGVSAIQEQREIILATIKAITRGDWKVLVVDEAAQKILNNVVKEDDILNENIANIERLEEKRDMNPDMDAIYLLSPQPHIVDCLMADFERRRYRRSFLVWTALLDPQLRRRIDTSRQAQEQLAGFETLAIDFYPRESHLITFRDPWSFPILYHPACNSLVRDHMQSLAQKITGICVSLGEYPKIRYYKPKNPTHEASVLCSHLARFVQEELDAYAHWNQNFPPPANRPPGVLIITDRAMDLNAPLLHEFTYQAMAHDVVPIREGDKVTYTTVIHQGTPQEEEKEMEITENDKIWLEFRHMHMKDALTRLDSDFKKFKEDNRNFDTSDANAQQNKSLSAVKDMAVGLTQFTETRDAYSLHINMAQDCMNIFGQHKLSDIALVEQPLATGLDEDYRKPKQMADQLVRLLDDESIRSVDRLRLIILYLMYRDGVINEDVQRLLAHSSLPPQDGEIIGNFELLGAQIIKQSLKETRPPAQPLFPRKSVPPQNVEVDAFSRFEPNLKLMLDELARGTLDQSTFPYTKAPEDGSEEMAFQTQASLRSAKPTWARNRMSTIESRQRVIVFMAGGATYSEARSCYESSRASGRDVFLATSHMLSPGLFIKQVQDLSQDRRRLDLPVDRPKPKAPAHLFMRNDPPPPPKPQATPQPQARPSASAIGGPPRPGMPSPAPPTQQMAHVNLNSPTPPRTAHGNGDVSAGKSGGGKLEKKKEPEKEKKKRGFFGSKK